MRTLEKFSSVYQDAVRFVKRHNKPVWIIPSDTDYHLSIIEPLASELPFGTIAVEYDYVITTDGMEVTGNTVDSSTTL